jgi:hypothetical protein
MSKHRSILFDHSAVAYLDILGFKEFMVKVEHPASRERAKFTHLLNVIDAQLEFTSDAGQQHLFPKDVSLAVTHVSDSFILSAPLQSARPHYNGLVAVSIKAIQIAHCLLDMGFLLRGGIAVGNLYRDKANVFGTGYQNAYETESKYANYPRILLHQSAVDMLETGTHNDSLLGTLSIFMKDGDRHLLDTLNTYWRYVGAEREYDLSATYGRYKATIEGCVATLPLGRPREKWQWMANYFNAKLRDCSDLSELAPIGTDDSARFAFYDGRRPGETFREAFAPFMRSPKVLR